MDGGARGSFGRRALDQQQAAGGRRAGAAQVGVQEQEPLGCEVDRLRYSIAYNWEHKWDAMESDFMNIRLKQPALPTTSTNTTTTTQPTTHEQTTYTTKDDDDTQLILSQLIDCCTSAEPRQLQQGHTSKKAATRISHDTHPE